MTESPRQREHVSASDFEALFRAVSTWGRWGENDQRGALNQLTPKRIAAAARLVHVRRLAELGAWDTTKAKPGLHPQAMPFLAERGVAALGCDGNSDTAPSTTEGSRIRSTSLH
jgi:kynurenine formamidase